MSQVVSELSQDTPDDKIPCSTRNDRRLSVLFLRPFLSAPKFFWRGARRHAPRIFFPFLEFTLQISKTESQSPVSAYDGGLSIICSSSLPARRSASLSNPSISDAYPFELFFSWSRIHCTMHFLLRACVAILPLSRQQAINLKNRK